LVASRDIAPGEVVMEEEPLVVGPNQETTPVCLGCMAVADCSFLCPNCGYPFCEQQCAEDPVHKQECPYLAVRRHEFAAGEVQMEAYHAVLPLRLLLLNSEGAQARLVEMMVEHTEERKRGEYWDIAQREVVQRLKEAGGSWGEDEVQSIVGKLELNSYELHSTVTGGFRASFPLSLLLNHSCLPNCIHLFTREPPFTALLMATRAIKAGEPLNVSYLPSTTCSLLRVRQLFEGWHFLCGCLRCSDPAESGANTNTMVCQSCKTPTLLPTSPRDWTQPWSCASCSNVQSSAEVMKIVEDFSDEIQNLVQYKRYDTTAWLELRERALLKCHPQHQICCDVAKWLGPVLARGPGKSLADFPREMLITKFTMADNYLRVLRIVEPGFSRNTAKTIFEKIDTWMFLSCDDFRRGKISQKDLGKRLAECKAEAEEGQEMLVTLGANTDFEIMVEHCLDRIVQQYTKFLLKTANKF